MTDLQPFQHGTSTLPGSVSPQQMAQVLRDFMAGFAPSSRVTMRYALSRAARDLGLGADVAIDSLPWHTLSAAALSELLYSWREDLDTSTIRLYMHALRGVARACFIRGMMPADQFALIGEVKLPKGRNKAGRGRAVEAHYKDALLRDCMADERIQGVRDAALIALLFGSGIRRAEAANLLDENLDVDEGELRVKVKGGDFAVRYISAWSLPYLKAWRDVRRANEFHRGPFLCRVWKNGKLSNTAMKGRSLFYLLEERSKRAGLPFLVRPHDARRTLGTEMLTEHGELIAQKVLGHADLSTTRIYDKRADNAVKAIFKNR
ncbi:site-specific integrase (plasmid) [Stutzerimonas frequens]|uniref:tyrosine-type recombinase/integrase n=1 Tax=Stutzerimonas frequens TaxID=2968969 RepID=UPI002DBAAA4E|nr:site-specific integrase [Stutzerimonas frequens]WRW29447.1 site-specific integrase [Stutzerimonas frequens]